MQTREPNTTAETIVFTNHYTMKTKHILPIGLCSILLLAGCVYEEGYGVGHVSVSTGRPYYYGSYDEYTPYYSYSGRRYYRSDGRYVYYNADRRPYYVTSVPRRAVYVTPPRAVPPPVVRHHRHHHDHDDD